MSPQGASIMEAVVRLTDRVVREEEGQDMVEYALILGLISIIAVASVKLAGDKIKIIWDNVAAAIP